MIIALTGTPGTGKTTVARELSKQINAVSVNGLVKKYRIPYGYDRERRTKIIDTKRLAVAAKKEAKKRKDFIVEGHLSHLLDADLVVILRCRPDVLEKRMRKKGWSENKIRENVEAEILDAVTIESLEKHGESKIIEIDTTRKTSKHAAALILNILNNHSMQNKYRPRINWTKKYSGMLLEK